MDESVRTQGRDSAQGVFITLEGGDGVGKSTHTKRLAAYLEAHGREVCRVHEPGGTELGEKIRSLLLDYDGEAQIDSRAELLLYEAARAQLVAEVVAPALAAGKVVLSDRFIDSTVAYQGYGRELGASLVSSLNEAATGGIMPDRTVLLLVDPEIGLERAIKRSKTGNGDRMEREGRVFHRRVREGFDALAQEASTRIRIIDATLPKPQVQAAVFAAVADLFPDIEQPSAEALEQ